MAKLSFLKRLVTEDFPKDSQALVAKIAFILNPALESISFALNKSLTFNDNFNAQVKNLQLTVGSDGVPDEDVQFKSELKGNCTGMWVVRAQNLTDSTMPTSGVMVSFSQSGDLITVEHVVGLPADKEFRLCVIAIV